MADSVTYADLRFEHSKHEGTKKLSSVLESNQNHHTMDGDIMYENVDGLQCLRERSHPPGPPAESPLMAGLRQRSPVWCLVASLLCLALSAAVIALAVKYIQTSSEESRHQTLSGSLSQSLQDQEELLELIREELRGTKAELEKTQMELKLAARDLMALKSSLTRSQQEEQNCTAKRRADEEKMRDNQSQLDQCESAREDLTTFLQEAESRPKQLEKDLCPEGWLLYGRRCFWFSKEKQTWSKSAKDCESRDANLITVGWSDKALKEFLAKRGEDFWVGKEWRKHENTWRWPSGYQKISGFYKISGGVLRGVMDDEDMGYYYTDEHRWICEKHLILTSLKRST